MTLREFVDSNEYTLIYFHNVFANSWEFPAHSDFELPFCLDDVEGEISNDEFIWDGEANITDWNRNTITCISVRTDQDDFEQEIINHNLFSETFCVSINEVDEDFILDTADYCEVSEKRIAQELDEFFDFDEAIEDADGDEDELEEIATAQKAIAKFLNS